MTQLLQQLINRPRNFKLAIEVILILLGLGLALIAVLVTNDQVAIVKQLSETLGKESMGFYVTIIQSII